MWIERADVDARVRGLRRAAPRRLGAIRRPVAWLGSLAALAVAFTAEPAASLELDFELFDHGGVVTSTEGVTVTARNFRQGHPHLAVAFDTTRSRTADSDLEFGSGWAGGNLAPQTMLGNILIIQENDDRCHTGTCRDPDDEGRRPAGTINLNFGDLGPFDAFAFDLVDVESASAENGAIEFFRDGSRVADFTFGDFLGLGQSVVYGNRTANHIDLGQVGEFDEVLITMGGSGGVDNIVAPEPATLALLALGLAGLGICARRERRT